MPMKQPAARPGASRTHLSTACLIASLALSLAGGFATPADAGCTNYENFLRLISTLECSGAAYAVDRQGPYTYIVGSQSLRIADYTNEYAPVLVGSLSLPGGSASVAVSGSVAAIANWSGVGDGLYLVDISAPTDPTLLASALPGDVVQGLAISGNYAFLNVSSPQIAFKVVDITDPAAPVLVKTVPLENAGSVCARLAIAGDHAYVAVYLNSGPTRINAIDISDPANAAVAGGINFDGSPNYSITDLTVDGSVLYAGLKSVQSFQPAALATYTLANPASPIRVGTVYSDIPGGSDGALQPRLAVSSGICYFATSYSSIYMYNVSNPASMTLINALSPQPGSLGKISIEGTSLYMPRTVASSPSQVHVVSVSSPTPMSRIGNVNTPGEAQSIAVAPGRAGLAYVADGAAGLQVIDISDPQHPFIVGGVDTPGFAVDVALLGNSAFVADREAGLQIVDITSPSAPTIIGSLDTPGLAVDLAVVDSLAYIADSDQGLRIVRVSVPSSPVFLGVQDTLTSVRGVSVSGAFAYVADGVAGLQVVNVSDPNNPWIVGGVKRDEIGSALKVDIERGFAYVTDTANKLHVVDISVPREPLVTGSISTAAAAGDVSVLGIFAYLGSGSSMKLVDVSDEASPAMLGLIEASAATKGVFADEFYAYMAIGANGLDICPTQCGFDGTVLAGFVADPQAAFAPITVNFTNESVGYGLKYVWDFGDGIGASTEVDPTYAYAAPGDYNVTLTADNGTNTDQTSLVVSALDEPPTITAVTDVPDDQGGFAYVEFYHSGFDDSGLGRSELYTIQRRDGDRWVSLASIGAYGEHYYTALAQTQGDGAESWTTSFRVIAHMDEGNWASAPMTGFSLDNIAPQAPENVFWSAPGRLAWDAVADDDFAYYRIYGADSPSFADAEKLAATVDTQIELGGVTHGWLFVVAVDDAELESEPSSPLTTTGIPGPATVVELAPAVPNPFNPSTAIAYALPRESRARLSVYDTRGRLVLDLLDGVVPAGRHVVSWRGSDGDGRPVPSGVYFSRLEADGTVLTRRMVLIR